MAECKLNISKIFLLKHAYRLNKIPIRIPGGSFVVAEIRI